MLFLASLVQCGRAGLLPLLPDVAADRVDVKRTCLCPSDPDLDRLRDLIRQGFGQVDASLMLWGPPPPPEAPEYGATPLSWTIWARLEARRIANRLRVQLGMEPEPETVESVTT